MECRQHLSIRVSMYISNWKNKNLLLSLLLVMTREVLTRSENKQRKAVSSKRVAGKQKSTPLDLQLTDVAVLAPKV